MSSLLLERQTRLIEYLTSGAAIFARSGPEPPLNAPPVLFGIDGGLLQLEARYSHEKRMAKIKWVLQMSFDLMGAERERIVQDFADACPPTGIGRLENARQFNDFLKAHWREQPREPPYLPDLAAFELAYAAVRDEDDTIGEAMPQREPQAFPGMMRRNPRAILLRCTYDIRPVLEGNPGEGTVAQSESRFALSVPRGAADPVILACPSQLFSALEALDHFTEPDVATGMLGGPELIAEFAANGLLEISQSDSASSASSRRSSGRRRAHRYGCQASFELIANLKTAKDLG